MLRPLLAFACLAATAFLLAPTVQSVHEQVEALDIKRDLPHLWKWDQPDAPLLLPPMCDDDRVPLYSEVDEWPSRIRKNETFTLGGFVRAGSEKGQGVGDIAVELFLNETKRAPGEALGNAVTGPDGRFTLTASVPFELQASKYHLVAHALTKRSGCTIYVEHWSDPEMEVASSTRFVLYPVDDAVVGHPFFLRGVLLDSVGAPVREAGVTVTVDGVSRRVVTDGNGEFRFEHNVTKPHNVTWSASFTATEYYGASKAQSWADVQRESLRLETSTIEIVRSRPSTFAGKLVLPPGARGGPLTVTLEGVRLATCEGCDDHGRFEVTPGPDGTFAAQLWAGPDQEPGAFQAIVTGGGMAEERRMAGRVVVPVNLTLDAERGGLFAKSLEGRVRLTDEVGRPWAGPVAVETAEGRHTGAADGSGTYAFSAATPCGLQRVRALYDGDERSMPAVAEQDVRVCPLLAFVPSWLLAVPWWGWLLMALAAGTGWYAYRRWRDATATTITRGPPLTLSHTAPRDAAAGIVGLGETATLTAFLEEPLPEGHSLRMGAARRMAPVEIGPDLRAEHHVTPERLGEQAIRAEILDARGRVVTRRTASLRVVRYAEEIEQRYRRLRREAGVSEALTPREFEAWLRERAPGLDPSVNARLVALFEEADYGPREASRREMVAYLEAESAVPEVSVRAALA